MADISKIYNSNIEGVANIYNASLTGISSIMGVDLVATGSGGPTPPEPPGDWVSHFHGVSDGFVATQYTETSFWDAGNSRFDDSYNEWGLSVNVDESSTWDNGYRPIKCRITGTPREYFAWSDAGNKSEITFYDATWATAGYQFVTGSTSEFYIFLNDNIANISIPGYSYVTNIEFNTTDDRVWVQHFYGVSSGYVIYPDYSTWNAGDQRFEEDESNPGYMILQIDASSTWANSYKPIGCKVTGSFRSGASISIYDSDYDQTLGSINAPEGISTVSFALEPYKYANNHIGYIEAYETTYISNIQFFRIDSFAVDYRPTQCRVTIDSGGFLDLTLYDTAGNSLASFSEAGEPGTATETLSWGDYDIGYFYFDARASVTTVSKIEFYSSGEWHDYTDVQYWGGTRSNQIKWTANTWETQFNAGSGRLVVKFH